MQVYDTSVAQHLWFVTTPTYFPINPDMYFIDIAINQVLLSKAIGMEEIFIQLMSTGVSKAHLGLTGTPKRTIKTLFSTKNALFTFALNQYPFLCTSV